MKYSICLAAAMAAASVNAAPTLKARADDSFDGKTVATWWGQSDHELTEVCDSKDFDVVILSFITHLDTPAFNLGKHTGAPSAAQKAKGWNNMFDGTVTPPGGKSVADQIKYCQGKGKKVTVSFGGDSGHSDATFKSTTEAKQAADYVWDLFLGGTGSTDLRPFGKDVTLDGLDLDNETGNGEYYSDFLGELKSKMGSSRSKYLLSAAPMCNQVGKMGTDTSIPGSLLGDLDFVNVQFYNNLQQGIGTPGFEDNFQSWAKQINAANKNTKMMLGVPANHAAATGAGPSIRTPAEIKSDLASIKGWKVPGFGGAAIWDAGDALDNIAFADALKGAL